MNQFEGLLSSYRVRRDSLLNKPPEVGTACEYSPIDPVEYAKNIDLAVKRLQKARLQLQEKDFEIPYPEGNYILAGENHDIPVLLASDRNELHGQKWPRDSFICAMMDMKISTDPSVNFSDRQIRSMQILALGTFEFLLPYLKEEPIAYWPNRVEASSFDHSAIGFNKLWQADHPVLNFPPIRRWMAHYRKPIDSPKELLLDTATYANRPSGLTLIKHITQGLINIQAGWPVDLPPLSIIAFGAVIKSLEKNGEGEIARNIAPAVWPVITRTLDVLYDPPVDDVKLSGHITGGLLYGRPVGDSWMDFNFFNQFASSGTNILLQEALGILSLAMPAGQVSKWRERYQETAKAVRNLRGRQGGYNFGKKANGEIYNNAHPVDALLFDWLFSNYNPKYIETQMEKLLDSPAFKNGFSPVLDKEVPFTLRLRGLVTQVFPGYNLTNVYWPMLSGIAGLVLRKYGLHDFNAMKRIRNGMLKILENGNGDHNYSPETIGNDGVNPHAPSNVQNLLPKRQSWTVSAMRAVLGE